MKKYLFSTMFWMLILALFPRNINAQTISELLPLDGLNLFVNTDNGTEGCTVSYDPNTRTITYDYPEGASSYGYAGWDFRGGKLLDLSAFSSLVLHLAETNIDPPGSIEFSIKYASSSVDSKFELQNVSIGANVSITMPLDAAAKNEIEYIYIKSANAGTLRIDNITASMDGQMDLSFDDFHKDWHGNTHYEYDSNLGMGIIFFDGNNRNDNWIPWGWGNDGRDFGEYDYFELDFGEPCAQDITIEVTYNPENQYPMSTITAPAGSEFVAIPFNKDVPSEYVRTDGDAAGQIGGGIRDIIIRSEGNESSILLVTHAYAAQGEVPQLPPVPRPDLTVTNISWEPASPQDGDQLNFVATVKNIGTLATPDNVKHGVVFRVYNTANEVVAITWSDNYYSSIAPDEEVLCKVKDPDRDIPGERGTGDLWTYWTAGGPYFVQAEVNDTNDFPELTRDNNLSEFFEIHDVTGINIPNIAQGQVYVENGYLHLKGFSPYASATIYNLQGQNMKNDYLQPGAYIVKVLDNGHLSIHKVIAK